MNAHVLNPQALALAATNEAILRALAAGPIVGDAAVAKAAGVAQKNVGRALKTLEAQTIVARREAGWTLLDQGRLALLAMDAATGAAPADPDALLLRHDQLRPNPLQPRKLDLGDPNAAGDDRTPDRKALDELKASIVAAGGLLQNLVVFPADAEGVYTISAGERRWRAVGELIEEGLWPADRRLRALQREATAGQVSFLALVENGQREPLTVLQQARAYADLTKETGWSARHAALQTGKSPRMVQELLQVLAEADPQDLARHEADPRDFTWEDLRETVRKPRAGSSEPEGVQGDVEAALEAQTQTRAEREPPANITDMEILTLVEIAARVGRRQHTSYGMARLFHTPDPTFIARFGLNGGCFFVSEMTDGTHMPNRRYLGLSSYGRNWLQQAGHMRPEDPVGDAVHYARLRLGLGREISSTLYETPWLRIDTGQTAKEKAARATASAPTHDETPPASYDPSDRPLQPMERLALIELAHRTQVARVADGWTRVWRYWTDKTFADLVSTGLIKVSHKVSADGPCASTTGRGALHLIQEIGTAAPSGDQLEASWRAAFGSGPPDGRDYHTPWLNEDPAADDAITGMRATAVIEDDPAPTHDSLDDDEFTTAQLVLDDVARGLDAMDDFDPAALLQRIGITFPLRINAEDRCIEDARGQAVLDVCGWGDLPDPEMNVRLLLVLTLLNAQGAAWQSPQGSLGAAQAAKAPADPALPIRRSITPETIVCLEDGAKTVSLTCHLRQTYGLTPDAYRERWGLPRDYPMVAPNEMYRRYQAMKALGVDPPAPDDLWGEFADDQAEG